MDLLGNDTRVHIGRDALLEVVDIGGKGVERGLIRNVDLGGPSGLENPNVGVDAITRAGDIGVERARVIKETRDQLLRESEQLLTHVKERVSNATNKTNSNNVKFDNQQQIHLFNFSSTTTTTTSTTTSTESLKFFK